ncbi:lactose-binding lectin l-2-like [Physella acuta]|uniref:lactose-binding lectin l-2-like n=1 Tax=Physella acuta TaxID=109671 RepID=UPI0027DB1519|nr:lactose-binding lectin l-2-like [Physella acuta]XP_059160907.1 lactose-binding lectin l-2-like [Physella acuta]XP_059160909.1 lactose-binding lectin l-2-like [Physella acuta]XP_059160910.1 lactose-binding lectin l-2-like [Physella acuta]
MWIGQLSQLVVSVLVLFIINSPGAVGTGSTLWDGGKWVDGRCFLLVRESATWVNALSACQNIGGTLATITSQTQLAALRAAFSIYNEEFWIGANDRVTEQTFVWTEDLSSASVIYSWWDSDAPHLARPNIWHCVTMRQTNKVYDNRCDYFLAIYMCMEPNSRTTKCIAPTTTEDVTTTTTETTTTLPTTMTTETIKSTKRHCHKG